MNVFKLVLLGAMTLFMGSAKAQKWKGPVKGEYVVAHIPINQDSIDSTREMYPIRRIDPIIFIEFSSSQTLKLKWNRRFKLTDDRGITDIGLNTDNPTIHGSYRIKNDTLILKYQYSVQHFFKSAPKRRVKIKFKQSDRPVPVKRFARTEKNTFDINQRSYWKRKGT